MHLKFKCAAYNCELLMCLRKGADGLKETPTRVITKPARDTGHTAHLSDLQYNWSTPLRRVLWFSLFSINYLSQIVILIFTRQIHIRYRPQTNTTGL